HRTDGNDTPPTSLGHATQARLADPIDRLEIGIHHTIPFIFFHAHQEVVASDTSIIDENGRCAKLIADSLDQGINASLIGHVQAATGTLDAIRLEIGIDALGASLGGSSTDHDTALTAQL